MDQNTFFTVLNSAISILTIVFYYPLFKANDIDDLYRSLETHPRLRKIIDRNNLRSYLRIVFFFSISAFAYGLTITDSDNEVDFSSAIVSLLVLLAILLFRTWKLRKLLGAPQR